MDEREFSDSLFGQDGTQAPPPLPVAADPLAGLVTGSVLTTATGWADESAVARLEVAEPARPDERAIRQAVDAAMAGETRRPAGRPGASGSRAAARPNRQPSGAVPAARMSTDAAGWTARGGGDGRGWPSGAGGAYVPPTQAGSRTGVSGGAYVPPTQVGSAERGWPGSTGGGYVLPTQVGGRGRRTLPGGGTRIGGPASPAPGLGRRPGTQRKRPTGATVGRIIFWLILLGVLALIVFGAVYGNSGSVGA